MLSGNAGDDGRTCSGGVDRHCSRRWSLVGLLFAQHPKAGLGEVTGDGDDCAAMSFTGSELCAQQPAQERRPNRHVLRLQRSQRRSECSSQQDYHSSQSECTAADENGNRGVWVNDADTHQDSNGQWVDNDGRPDSAVSTNTNGGGDPPLSGDFSFNMTSNQFIAMM